MSDTEELKAKVETLEEQLKKLSIPKPESKTVYISKDRKLQKFSGRPIKETDPSVEEWAEDVSYHIKNINFQAMKPRLNFCMIICRGRPETKCVPGRQRKETRGTNYCLVCTLFFALKVYSIVDWGITRQKRFNHCTRLKSASTAATQRALNQ